MDSSDSQTLTTKSIKESISSAADFEIFHVETYVKDTSQERFTLLNIDVNSHYKDKTKLINEHTEFEQYYTIKILNEKSSQIELKYTLEYGEFCSHPKIILNPNSYIAYKLVKPQEMFNLLLKEINKIKAKNGILINIFDESMINNLKAFTKHIYSGKFTKRVKIPLFDGLEPIITKQSELIFHFKNREHASQVIEVEENELLIEYMKPVFGFSGFDAYGKEIASKYVHNRQDLSCHIDLQSITVIEEERRKLYRSKIKGYVHYSRDSLYIDNRVILSKISRNEDILAAQEENNIEVTITQSDTTKDSVGEGVELTSEFVHINGHVGANSIIEATKLTIDGATHHDSTQFAKSAHINRHKGKLRCHEAQITLLEGGEVHATSVSIETALGGAIYAKDVEIMHVKNNLKVYASNSITVKLVSGENNLFKINYKEIPILNSKLTLIDDDIEELKYELTEATRHNPSALPLIKEKIQNFKDQKESIVNSTQTAQITLKSPLHGLNTISFTLNDGNELIFKTEALSYETFYLEIDEQSITLQPVNISLPL